MDKRYATADDAAMRLNESIVRYKGEPYMAICYEDLQFRLYKLSEGFDTTKRLTVDANDPELDISSIDLGYVNWTQTGVPNTAFIARAPYRRQKQGVSSENLTTTYSDNKTFRGLATSDIMTKDFEDMVRGIYPRYSDPIINERRETAISRNFMVQREKDGTQNLFFNCRKIGVKKADRHGFLLDDMSNSVILLRLSHLGVPVAY